MDEILNPFKHRLEAQNSKLVSLPECFGEWTKQIKPWQHKFNEVVFNIDLWGSGIGDSHRLRGLNIWSIYCSRLVIPSSMSGNERINLERISIAHSLIPWSSTSHSLTKTEELFFCNYEEGLIPHTRPPTPTPTILFCCTWISMPHDSR